ncbi:hypothetical protein L9F63_017407, partial [Diploptera punctata]
QQFRIRQPRVIGRKGFISSYELGVVSKPTLCNFKLNRTNVYRIHIKFEINDKWSYILSFTVYVILVINRR